MKTFKTAFLLIIGLFFLISCEKNKDKDLPIDGDGNVYDTVVIGIQVWLKQNLKTTKYNTGMPLKLVTDPKDWSNVSEPAVCFYNNIQGLKDPYGALYNWRAARLATICPVGWRNPTKDEWSEMIDYLGGTNVAANKLKEIGLTHWNTNNSEATNKSGFTALPAGNRAWYGDFTGLSYLGVWWTSSPSYDNSAFQVSISSSSISISRMPVSAGYSVRCIKYK